MNLVESLADILLNGGAAVLGLALLVYLGSCARIAWKREREARAGVSR